MDRSSRPVTLVAVVVGMAAVAVLVVAAIWVAFAPAPAGWVGRADPAAATLAELIGPWRAAPLRLDPVTEMKADQACRSDSEFPDGMRLVLADARGGGKLPTIYVGDDSMADCVYTEIGAAGQVSGSLSSVQHGLGGNTRPGKLSPGGGGGVGGAGGWTYTSGRVGEGIVTVVVSVAGIGPITATIQNGWYLAWWEGAPDRGGPRQPRTVTAFDASGSILDQVTEGR